MGAPPAAAACTSSAPPVPRRRSTRLLIDPQRRDDQDHQPPLALLSSSKTASTPAQPRRRSGRLIGIRRSGDQPPPSPRASTPPPPAAEAAVAHPPPGGAPTPRRSPRVHLRVRGLPSAASPSTPRRRRRSPTAPRPKSIEAKVEEWRKEKAALGVPEEECVLPFLLKGAPRKVRTWLNESLFHTVECLICSKSILPDERTQCSVNHCEVTLHRSCSAQTDGCCPQHVSSLKPNCYFVLCSQFDNCIFALSEAFQRLPLPYTIQEFNIDPIKKKDLESGTEPPPYVHLKRTKTFIWSRTNVMVMELKVDVPTVTMTQLVKVVPAGMSCSFHLLCSLVSCSQACHCSVKCSNKPFRKEKRIKIVKTQHCGWGAIALETIENDDFVIEFVGEEYNPRLLQDMRQRRDQNFYMCKVSKDFVIDATFRGNACRFINHSCQPNCRLEKWQVNGKTRLGVFASETIKVGMPLTYNYRFSPSFGPEKECFCGAPNCRGKL
ncbi:hypothetical protein HU200_003068 [Digitaria exilis]|uniref:Histone-lysine N-methyltransferase n=1 Tax=Digitaria exilis TaxID=1010633 RepID=A0A835KYQ6_9POAL|nr:hypothetical protein HU200_003068 [Digitaria exilis]